jgi:hypothetical protein
MGIYIYLSCKTCNEYIHIGKTSGSNFELSYDRMKRFLMTHSSRRGCVLMTVNDSICDSDYAHVIQGKEMEE